MLVSPMSVPITTDNLRGRAVVAGPQDGSVRAGLPELRARHDLERRGTWHRSTPRAVEITSCGSGVPRTSVSSSAICRRCDCRLQFVQRSKATAQAIGRATCVHGESSRAAQCGQLRARSRYRISRCAPWGARPRRARPRGARRHLQILRSRHSPPKISADGNASRSLSYPQTRRLLCAC